MSEDRLVEIGAVVGAAYAALIMAVATLANVNPSPVEVNVLLHRMVDMIENPTNVTEVGKAAAFVVTRWAEGR